MRAVIIDDEPNGRQVLERLLGKTDMVEIVGSAENVETGYEMVLLQQPDIVFLDVEMPDGLGFDILKKLAPVNFKVIFVTAYDHYALKAIKFSALDYLLKPVNPMELAEAISKVRNSNHTDRIDHLISSINGSIKQPRIAISSASSINYINIDQIVRLQAEGNYTDFYLMDGKKHTAVGLLKDYADLIHDHGFFRAHRSHMINLKYVVEFIRGGQDIAVMADDSRIEVSRKRKADFIRAMSRIHVNGKDTL